MAGAQPAGTSVHVPWYATVFRADKLAAVVADIAPVALRYGATSYRVYRSRDDAYKILQVADFEDKLAWERYWHGDEFCAWRERHAGWFQVPVVYAWQDVLAAGALEREAATTA